MVTREVDVVIKGRNQAGPAFRGAKADIDVFSKSTSTASTGVGKLQTNLGNLATQLAGLPGPVGRLAQSLGQFAIGGPVTIAVLGGIAALSAAWRAFTKDADDARKMMEELHKQELSFGVTAANARLRELHAERESLELKVQDLSPKGYFGAFTMSFAEMWELRETEQALEKIRERIKALAPVVAKLNADAAGNLKGLPAIVVSASRRENAAENRAAEIFDKAILPQLGNGSTIGPSLPGLSGGVQTPTLGKIGEGAGVGPIMAEQIGAVEGAVLDLSDSIRGTAKDAIVEFADTWAQATQEMITGSGKLGDAIVRAGRRAVGGVLMAKGRETLLDAAKAAVQGFTNPAEFVKAAKLFAIGTAQTAAGQLFSGGGSGGGGGGLGAGGFSDQRNETSDGQGDATIVIQGGILDTGDARQMDALAAAIRELGGTRRIQIVGA